jgi:hypothetical protein
MLEKPTYDLYLCCLCDKAVIGANKHWEEKFRDVQQAHKQLTMSEEEIHVETHAQFIVDNLINARCPGCSANFGGFDACSAIKCTCGVYFCGWCLILVEADDSRTARIRCHDHVREDCRFNPHRNLFPPHPHPAVWQEVMHELGRKRVRDYIQDSGGVWWMVDDGVRCMAVRWCMSGAIVVGDNVFLFIAVRWCMRPNPNPQCLSL